VQLTKAHLRDLYRPVGPKKIQTNIAWSQGGSTQIAQQVDLSLPIRGIRIVFKGRIVVGTAAFTNINPEGVLNLLPSINIQGTNSRQNGNITLWNTDAATLFSLQHLFAYRGSGYLSLNSGSGETISPIPSTPFPSSGFFTGATGTYDFRVVLDVPFHPFEFNANGKQPLACAGFLMRNEEWKDSVTISLGYGAQATNAEGSLGLAAATTTVTFTAYGSGSGTPTIDVYSLPVMSGLDMKDQFIPGVLSRTSQSLSGTLQAAGSAVALANLQKQPTPRIYLKVGTSLFAGAFKTLSDVNVTTLGVVLGGNRNVRNLLDIWTKKIHHIDVYDRDPIQGYLLEDFVEQGNYESAFPGQDVGDGATFQLVGDVAGVANAAGIVVQEQLLHMPAGPLFS
jgi:hypothetical protein